MWLYKFQMHLLSWQGKYLFSLINTTNTNNMHAGVQCQFSQPVSSDYTLKWTCPPSALKREIELGTFSGKISRNSWYPPSHCGSLCSVKANPADTHAPGLENTDKNKCWALIFKSIFFFLKKPIYEYVGTVLEEEEVHGDSRCLLWKGEKALFMLCRLS